jgi:hypothetical protein
MSQYEQTDIYLVDCSFFILISNRVHIFYKPLGKIFIISVILVSKLLLFLGTRNLILKSLNTIPGI